VGCGYRVRQVREQAEDTGSVSKLSECNLTRHCRMTQHLIVREKAGESGVSAAKVVHPD
jgi:hypothetical protein